jgi:hypothetical protein
MRKVTIIEAEQKVIDLRNQDGVNLTCFLFYEKHCPKCNEFLEQVAPWLESQGIETFGVDIGENFIPFPPAVTPTTYWFILKDYPPMIKRGLPPSLDMLQEEVRKMISVNKGVMGVEQAFF